MKIRSSFVSNSSSSSFIIRNISNENKTLVDFVNENPQLLEQFKCRYDWYADDPKYNQKMMVQCAEKENITFYPNVDELCTFGDEDGTVIGNVFDYILRDGGKSESFVWKFDHYNR